jgi:exosortase/archaeosortase family protein
MHEKLFKGLQEERMKETLVFFLRLLAFSVPLYLIMIFADLYPLQVLVAGHSFRIMEGLGLSPQIQGPLMRVGDFHFFISRDSTAWKSMLFLGALVFAVPSIGWKRRLAGLGGIPVIYLGNLGRVAGIVLAERAWGMEAAMALHDWLWRIGLIALVLGIWLAWLMWARRS